MKNNNNIEKTSDTIGWFEKMLEITSKYRISAILKTLGVIVLLAATVGFINNPMWIFEQYDKYKDKQHIEKLSHRLEHNEKIHILTEKLLYRVNADRVLLLELHNGNSGLGGIPFAKCSATYEALNDGVVPVANEYQEMNLSLMPFANKLFDNGYWCGDTENLKEIDKALCYRMLGHDTSHFCGVLIRGVNQPLAFLFVKFKNVEDGHSCQEIRRIIEDSAYQIALLIELNKH